MRTLRIFLVLGSVFLLSITRAYAVQIDLSGESVDRYFQILEHYVLPLMVVSTIVLFCGYLASRIFHRTVSRRQDSAAGRAGHPGAADDGTEAFLRELKASPPIDDSDARREPTVEPNVEHKARPAHPLLRRRREATAEAAAESAAFGRERADAMPTAKPLTAARDDRDGDAETPAAPAARKRGPAFPTARVDQAAEEAPEAQEPQDEAQERQETKTAPRRVPLLKAAFRRPRQKAADAEAPLEPTPIQPRPVDPAPVIRRREAPVPQTERAERPAPARENKLFGNAARNGAARETVENEAAAFPVETLRANEPASTDREPRNPERQEPTLTASPDGPAGPGERRREEPTISVVQSLKTAPVPPVAAAVKARAGEVVDSLDYIASVLQQGSVLLAERLKKKQGLSLEDVRGLRVTGYDEPDHVLEDLRKLGGDAAEEVLNAFAAVNTLNNIVRRLEQMAETAPLDEGWNELVRSRISETIFAVGQVRKTLGIYRPAGKRPRRPGMAQERDDAVPEPDSSVPIGRRQV